MGNDTSQPPKSYSGDVAMNKQQVVHEGEFLQTYRGAYPGGDTVNMGVGVQPMTLGVKINQLVDDGIDYAGKHYGPNEYYVVSPSGKRTYLTQGGVYKPNADRLVQTGKGYGAGPAVVVGGPVGSPTYTVFSATSTTPGSAYTPMRINNVGDWQKAVWYGHENDSKGQYASRYGSAAINPFKDRPRNAFSFLADVGRTTLQVVDAVAVPVIEWGLDAVTDGTAGTLLQVSGLDNFLQQGLDKLTELHGLDYSSTTNTTSPYFSNIVQDPRLDAQFSKMMRVSRTKAFDKTQKNNQYQKELQKLVNSTNHDNARKIATMHKLQEQNLRYDGEQQIDILSKTMAMLKKMVPNPPDFKWDLAEQGLKYASDPRMKIEFAERTTENLMKRVVPFMKKQAANPPLQQNSTAQPAPKVEKKDPDPTQKVGSGFINGSKRQSNHPSEIRGFIPEGLPITGF